MNKLKTGFMWAIWIFEDVIWFLSWKLGGGGDFDHTEYKFFHQKTLEIY